MANKGLGRGYASLLGLNDLVSKPEADLINLTKDGDDGVVRIPIIDIDPNREQPRKKFDEQALNELADSIRIYDVVQPIIVTPVGKRFMIIAGERRFRASQIAGKRIFLR